MTVYYHLHCVVIVFYFGRPNNSCLSMILRDAR